MPRHLIGDAHEWVNEISTVPECLSAIRLLGERALLCLTLDRGLDGSWDVE